MKMYSYNDHMSRVQERFAPIWVLGQIGLMSQGLVIVWFRKAL